mgnify:CR=1 FL=1
MIDNNLATVGGGCFWCVEAIFDCLKGVERVESGYSGGFLENPTYEEVCDKNTGHAEVVQILFNPKLLSYEQILYVFFSTHDPTTMNQQGYDVGTQYRSIILTHNPEQRVIAEKVIEKINSENIWNNPIVTKIEPFEEFYNAEDYHQKYFSRNSNNSYCMSIISPKVSKFRKLHKELLKTP